MARGGHGDGHNMTAVFELKDLCFAYGEGMPALAGVNLRIDQGERVALLGANGSGKSTLLRILGGLLQPTGGEISAFGAPLTADLLRDEPRAQAFRQQRAEELLLFEMQDEDVIWGLTLERALERGEQPGPARHEVPVRGA